MSIAAVSFFKAEWHYLREWLHYHRLIGIDKFYLTCNDQDADRAYEILEPYIEAGWVAFEHDPSTPGFYRQTEAFNRRHREVTQKWTAFIDLDEFIVVEGDNLPNLLRRYDDECGLVVEWYNFGTSFRKTAPTLQTRDLIWRASNNFHRNQLYKTIAKTNCIERMTNPHGGLYKGNRLPVDEHKSPVSDQYINTSRTCMRKEHIWLNHYRIRSQADWQDKKIRWEGGGHPFLSSNPEHYFNLFDRNEIQDMTIHRLVPSLISSLASPL